MQVFDKKTRILKVPRGITFFEKDILPINYHFVGDMTLTVRLIYQKSGFGIVLGKKDGPSLMDVKKCYVFRIENHAFSVTRKVFSEESEVLRTSHTLLPSSDEITLLVKKKGALITLTKASTTESGEKVLSPLGTYTLDETFGAYYLGFYSVPGNIITRVTIDVPVERPWETSIENVRGGRILLERNAFSFENCVHDAEMEEPLTLDKGTYYLSYEKENVGDRYDITPYVLMANSLDRESIETLDDAQKNILQDGHSFTLNKKSHVRIRFKGTSGKVKRMRLSSNKHAPFVETKGKVMHSDGSFIEVDLDGLTSVQWEFEITHVPPYENLTEPSPYAVIHGKNHAYFLEELSLKLGTRYHAMYDARAHTCTITEVDTGTTVSARHIPLPNNTLRIIENMTATVYALTLTDNEGKEKHVLTWSTTKRLLPSTITSPIIVTDANNYSLSYDLSASYREVVTPQKKLYFHVMQKEIPLPNPLPIPVNPIKVYVSPKGAFIDVTKDTLEEFASIYYEVPTEDYERTESTVTLSEKYQDKYPYVIIEYLSTGDYTYEFTNYEREVFPSTDALLKLAKRPSLVHKRYTLYAIPHEAYVDLNNIYKVPPGIPSSIDYTASSYDIISNDAYEVDEDSMLLHLKENLASTYKLFILDYLKENSYAINTRHEEDAIEVDISSEKGSAMIHYKLDGADSTAHLPLIDSDDAYVVLERKGNEA